MVRSSVICLSFCLLASVVSASEESAAPPSEPAAAAPQAATPAAAQPQTGPVVISGMSILGNQEAPKSLVIVPWKSSEIGTAPALSRLLDDSIAPVDKEVFMRELAYYEIRSN